MFLNNIEAKEFKGKFYYYNNVMLEGDISFRIPRTVNEIWNFDALGIINGCVFQKQAWRPLILMF